MSRVRNLRVIALLACIALCAVSLVMPTQGAIAAEPRSPLEDPEPVQLVRLYVPNNSLLDYLLNGGYDLAGNVEQMPQGILVDAVLTASEMATLSAIGVEVLDWLSDDLANALWHERMEERVETAGLLQSVLAATDDVRVMRADYVTNQGASFLSVEARTSAGASASVTMRVAWDVGPGTDPGDGGTASMSRFTDAGQYMYHRILIPVGARPHQVTVSSSQGGQATRYVSDWLYPVPPEGDHYVSDFIDRYMDPTEVYERIEALAAEFPDIAEIVELPYKTNGYRRKAQATMGSFTNTAVVVSSVAWGHEGGNNITVQLANPGQANSPLTVSLDGNDIVVNLATNSSGQLTSRAVDVVTALNTQAAELVQATTYRGNAGAGVVTPIGRTSLTDFLNAPDHVSREPFTVRAIRIGKQRDGSKLGVLAYSQEHAREWVTPLVAVESAERLLRNYATDDMTRKLVDNLDIFIIPSVNPDGGHYSLYDFPSQRRNMTNHCGPTESDPAYRNAWGVDNNRNYGVGNLWQGYAGASTSCRSDTFAGPAPLSEPESANVVWLAETFDNVKFSLNVHSHGGYFMWAPGAYKSAGRVTLPRPTFGEEAMFWQMSDRILSEIYAHRGVAVVPSRTGATADVLYSAAGNSADHLWYDLGIYAINFEVGAQQWNGSSWVSVGFQPPFREGHEEAMEYANGLIALLKVAYDYGKDHQKPKSELVVNGKSLRGKGKYDGPVEVRFYTPEPANIYYTTDGTRPTLSSPVYKSVGIRDDGEILLVTDTTQFHWFAVDIRGNVEHNYNPDSPAENYSKATIEIGQ